MVFTRQKARVGENPESPSRNQSGTNIREVHTPSRTVFTQEKNELFVQRVVQYFQGKEGDEFHYHILGLDWSSTEDEMKKSYRNLARQFHLDKNNHSQASGVMLMIKEAK